MYKYKDKKGITFEVEKSNFVTFIGELNDYILSNLFNNKYKGKISVISYNYLNKLSNVKLKDKYVDMFNYNSNSNIVIYYIVCALSINSSILVFDNVLSLLSKSELELVIDKLNKLVDDGLIVFNFTYNIEESLYGNNLLITDKNSIVIMGNTLSVLNEEVILKRLGIGLPFIVELNKYLIDYKLIDSYELDYNKLGSKVWK